MNDTELNLLILALCLASFVLGRMSKRKPVQPELDSTESKIEVTYPLYDDPDDRGLDRD